MASAQAMMWQGPMQWLARLRIRIVVVALVSVLYGVVVAYNGVALMEPPQLSCVLVVPSPSQARITWLFPGGTLWDHGVRVGDTVLALDGRPPTRRDAGHWSGQRLQVRTGTGRSIVVETQMILDGQVTWPLLLLSPCFLILGTLVVLRAPQPAAGRAAYALFAGVAFILAFAPADAAEELAGRVGEKIVIDLSAYAFVLFFLAFPIVRGTRALRTWLALPPLGDLLCYVVALLYPAWYDATYSVAPGLLLVYLAWGIALLVKSYRTTSDPDLRRGLMLISAGAPAAFAPLVVLVLLPAVLGWPSLVPAEEAVLALVLLPVSFAYAMLRHDFLQVPLLQRWLVHGLVWSGLLVLYALLLSALYRLFLEAFPSPRDSLGLGMVLLILIGVSFRPLYDRLRQPLDRLIFRDTYDYRGALERFSRELSLTKDLTTLGASLPRTLRRLMNLNFAVLSVQDVHGLPHIHGADGRHDQSLLPALIAEMASIREAPRVAALAHDDAGVLVTPLHTHGQLVGHLCLGPKASGEPFRPEDHALLATLSGHLAAIVRNVQLVADLQAKVTLLETQKTMLDTLHERLQHAQEEERARLAADLHDEPLQTAQHLQRQLVADGRQCATTARHVPLTATLIAQLRAICTAVRPAALDELGLGAALEVLALDLAAHTGVPVTLDADPEMKELALSRAVEVVLYRTAQEALNNSLRHARPASLRISLQRQADTVRLRVIDDGMGFAVPASMDGLVAAGHLGLGGLRHRVQRAGGRLSIVSTPGQGTIVQVEFPRLDAGGAAG